MVKPMEFTEKNIETDTLIVGYGYTAIPLVRELQREQRDFLVISDGPPIWDQFEQRDRLDFDLVSSAHSTFFSFDLVERNLADDFIPNARQFLDAQRRIREQHQPEQFIRDRVSQLDNFPTHSEAKTRDGRTIKAKHVVFATGFHREINQTLVDFDFKTENKTIVLATSGDSANLMVSRLIPRGNRIIILSNGMFLLEKVVSFAGRQDVADQNEAHNFRNISKILYRMNIGAGMNIAPRLGFLGRTLLPHCITIARPEASVRLTDKRRRFGTDAMPNGFLVIKLWPIDCYVERFDNEQLVQHIRDGYVLDDMAFFVDQELLEVWPKRETTIDTDAKSVEWDGKTVPYDIFIDSSEEAPNLPDINICSGDSTKPFDYQFRQCFMGVLPKALHQVYFIGYTRPTSGGIGNISEMQCLLAHRLITDEPFAQAIRANIGERLRAYERKYYPTTIPGPTDHLVWYGSFTDDVAIELGIRRSLWQCRSLKEIYRHLWMANDAIKYRTHGRYAVDGAKEFVENIDTAHYRLAFHWTFSWVLVQGPIIAAILLSPLPFWVSVPLSLLQAVNPYMSLVTGNIGSSYIPVNSVFAIGLLATALTQSFSVALVSVFVGLSTIAILRLRGRSRLIFGDLKFRREPRYKAFFQRYRKAFIKAQQRPD